MSDAILQEMQNLCVDGARCDYGVGSHEYTYDPNLTFPPDPWLDLPTIEVDDPDDLPQ